MPDPTVRCPICGEPLLPRVPVIFDLALLVHVLCYTGAEGTATLAYDFLETRPSERFCYTCLGQHLLQDRQAVVEPTICSTCDNARVTVGMRQGVRLP
jgi:hypothetical protein